MDIKFWVQILVAPIISALVAICIAFWQYRKRKDEEKKTAALKVLLGAVRGWQSYIQSAANANTILRNHIRGNDDSGTSVTKFSSLADVESAVDANGAFLNGLHIGVEREIEEINRALDEPRD